MYKCTESDLHRAHISVITSISCLILFTVSHVLHFFYDETRAVLSEKTLDIRVHGRPV